MIKFHFGFLRGLHNSPEKVGLSPRTEGARGPLPSTPAGKAEVTDKGGSEAPATSGALALAGAPAVFPKRYCTWEFWFWEKWTSKLG